MKFLLPMLMVGLAATAAHADVKRSPNMLRDAFTLLTLLKDEGTVRLVGETDDDDEAEATITLGKDGKLDVVRMHQDGVAMRLPDAAWQGITGAQQAWLEERGACTTLVIEGEDKAGEWRLALIFHPEQLWKRRLSREGRERDHFTFYNRDEDEQDEDFDYTRVIEEEHREGHGRGFYNMWGPKTPR